MIKKMYNTNPESDILRQIDTICFFKLEAKNNGIAKIMVPKIKVKYIIKNPTESPLDGLEANANSVVSSETNMVSTPTVIIVNNNDFKPVTLNIKIVIARKKDNHIKT